ncbi:hypothetical protein Tco_1463498, partial [Tanacetum coccineum]
SPSYSSSTYTVPSNSKTGSQRSGNVIEDVLQSFVADTEPEQQLAYYTGYPRTIENSYIEAEDEGIFDSGCARSMTGNMERLDDFHEFQGGKVTFGGGKGRITGKGTIRTPTLDFENVYYVKELQQFNLFSISQICDKKNRVLFTYTDCLVLLTRQNLFLKTYLYMI